MGVVTDQQGAAIPGAHVQVLNLDSGVTIDSKSDGSGNYTIPFLPAAHYQLSVDAPGFKPAVYKDLPLGMGQAFVYNVTLAVGSAESTVDVDAGSEVAQVDTQSAEMSGTITGKEVTAIGLNGRDYNQLIALVPGV
jgi:hypothetical protein